MERHRKSIIAGIGIGFGIISFIGGCSHREEPMVVDTRTAEEEDDEATGISFEMDSDSLEEDVEEVWFGVQDWGEENMGVDV